MAAFSYYQHLPFLLDPVFHLPNTPIKIPGFSEEPNNTTTTTITDSSYFSQSYPPQSQSQSQSLHQIPVDLSAHESSCLENVTKVYLSSNNEPSPSVTNINKHSTDSSSVVDKPESTVDQVTRKVSTTMDSKRKRKSNYSPHSKHAREVKGKKQNKCNSVKKDDDEEKRPKADDIKKAALEEAPKGGYIHVRARRGQATDSHSLAERVRREKISERMKMLQALVPGCDKVSGKALMLDEIISYVQSLQNQVEFLSMKLASVNPMFYDFGMDLDALMVTPDQRLDGSVQSPPPFQNVQQQFNPPKATAFSDGTTSTTSFIINTTPNTYPLLEYSTASSSLLFQQGQPQDNGQLLWDVHDQRQKLINQSGFGNLCSFY
ncbi:hypothetical protein ACSBR2_042398 [Camellia fascicularis]